jgi:adenosylcobinamide kinase/adenosylcobinamide-phosphate guanylyltransferase
MHELILGGQKSGKSRAAESRAAGWLTTPGHEALLVATAIAGDPEMAARIERHRLDRARRVPGLRTLEEPRAVARVLLDHTAAHRLLVVDCLTLWLTNLLLPLDRAAVEPPAADDAGDELIAALAACTGPVVLVSNEIGLGLTPMSAQARRFVDTLGALHQRLGRACEHVSWIVAGRTLRLPPPEAG